MFWGVLGRIGWLAGVTGAAWLIAAFQGLDQEVMGSVGLALAAVVMLVWERWLTRQELQGWAARTKALGGALPPPLRDGALGSWASWLLFCGALGVGLVAGCAAGDAPGLVDNVLLAGLFAVMALIGAWVAHVGVDLLLDRLSLWGARWLCWRLERAAPKAPVDPEPPAVELPPRPKPTRPMTAVVLASVALSWALDGGADPQASSREATAPQVAPGAAPKRAASVEFLLELGPDDDIREVAGTLRRHGAVAEPAFPSVTMAEDADLGATWLVRAPASTVVGLAKALVADPENVDHIELNSLLDAPDDSVGGPCTPALRWWGSAEPEPLDPSLLHPAFRGDAPFHRVLVGVVDSGVWLGHPALSGVIQDGDLLPRDGHGTQVAGVVAALTRGGWGVAVDRSGRRWIQVRSYPVFADGRPGVQAVVEAVEQAIDDGVDVLNLSFSAVGDAPRAMEQILERAQERGVLVVAAGGNDNVSGAERWPANVPGVIAVGGATQTRRMPGGGLSWLRGVWAPGEVCTTSLDGGFRLATGSSFAAPQAAGVLATARTLCPRMGSTAAYRLLGLSSERLDGDPWIADASVIDRLLREGCP